MGRGAGFTALGNGLGELFQDGDRLVETDAGVRDADAVFQGLAGDCVLAAWLQMALDHDACEAPISARDLFGQVGGHLGLVVVILFAVGVARIDHDAAL